MSLCHMLKMIGPNPGEDMDMDMDMDNITTFYNGSFILLSNIWFGICQMVDMIGPNQGNDMDNQENDMDDQRNDMDDHKIDPVIKLLADLYIPTEYELTLTRSEQYKLISKFIEL